MAPSSDNNESSTKETLSTATTKKKKASQGVYVRPSGAIERGSGFFVPGLEGPRVRLAFGTVLVVLTVSNHFLMMSSNDLSESSSGTANFSFQETLAIGYSLLILFQSAIEYTKEQRSLQVESSSTATIGDTTESSTGPILKQEWSTAAAIDDGKDDSYRSKVQWAAVAYMSMTPSQEIMLLSNRNGNATILYRLASSSSRQKSDDATSAENISKGVQAAIEEVSKSKGGRISLPLTHPAVQALVLPQNVNAKKDDDDIDDPLIPATTPRTVVVQRINDQQCWMVVSNQLLASYASADLKWLGQMAEYVAMV